MGPLSGHDRGAPTSHYQPSQQSILLQPLILHPPLRLFVRVSHGAPRERHGPGVPHVRVAEEDGVAAEGGGGEVQHRAQGV
eukprot:8332636-Pyramimonas_sp.AAC.1